MGGLFSYFTGDAGAGLKTAWDEVKAAASPDVYFFNISKDNAAFPK